VVARFVGPKRDSLKRARSSQCRAQRSP
jgi:hypothetical protein